MNDITALAQGKSLRKKLNRRMNDALGFRRTSGGKHNTISLSIDECKSVIAALDERLALVEALEKREELRASANRVVNQQDIELQELRQRIDSLESRTVKLPPRVDSSNVPFTAHTWNCCLDAVEKCLTAAGIQVIDGEG